MQADANIAWHIEGAIVLFDFLGCYCKVAVWEKYNSVCKKVLASTSYLIVIVVVCFVSIFVL